jgi:hypothetical protein
MGGGGYLAFALVYLQNIYLADDRTEATTNALQRLEVAWSLVHAAMLGQVLVRPTCKPVS